MEEGSKVRKRDNSESGDFVIVKQGDNSTTEAQDSDTSFEELHVEKATRETSVQHKHLQPVQAIDYGEISDTEMLKISESVLTFETPKATQKVVNPYLKKA